MLWNSYIIEKQLQKNENDTYFTKKYAGQAINEFECTVYNLQ